MKNDLTCGVVRDLLPSYVENLLGEDSREAVERHLKTCPACTAQKEAMAAQAAGAPEPEEAAKEVDYLKRVKKGTLKKVTLAVVCTALVLLGGIALKLFVIGTPLQAQSVAVIGAHDNGDQLRLILASVGSGNAFHGWKMETVDGVTSIYARDVLVSPLYSSGQAQLTVPLNFVREVWLGGTSGQGRLLWADGLLISQQTLDLLDAKTPYCGDAPALGRIAELLKLSQTLGPYTTSLHTSSQPYVWTLEFQEPFNTEKWQTTRYYMCQMLALVENLDKVSYRYRLENDYNRVTGDWPWNQGSVSVETASKFLAGLTEKYNELHQTDWPVHESIKEYTQSPLEYQRMVTLLTEHLSGLYS